MSIKLRKHNEEAYEKIQEEFKHSKKVAVIHPTGTGKSFLALKLIEDNKDKRAMYIVPSNAILHTVKNNILDSGMNMTDFTNLKRITYQKLMKLSDEEIEKLGIDMIVLDEFHHCGAPGWGEGIDRLLEKYPDAQVLGLSATPIRYFDYSRDMAKELFANNIASEMTLEEAINNGILPRAKYVSALYEFDSELEKIKDDIEKIRDSEKKQQAQILFKKLDKQVDKNAKNLPTILSEHMKAKNGKYIVFCKNIEDMEKNIKKAQNMFGEVNQNITTYAVSSKMVDNERTLRKFEKDNNENTLKLMFAVDMLNEGYHINDLDGIIMMRPTYSPTIYAQQLGRALTVKEYGSEPVVIDLVNNLDSIKIIEDLYERLQQYKPTGEHRKEQKQQGGLIIYDTTKEFRDIVRKISELSIRKTISLQEKIEILERFFEEGNNNIDGQTIFEGEKIGKWVIDIRHQLRNNSKNINPTEEQLERLKNLGILERRIDSTIDEKIDALIEWKNKYPNIKIEHKKVMNKPISNKIIAKLKEVAKTEGIDFKDIECKYKKLQNYNYYVRERDIYGKLTYEQKMKCKEGNLGGRFGFTTETERQAEKFKIEIAKVMELQGQYGTVENFVQMYREGKLSEEEIKFYNETLINNMIDIDCNPLFANYANLLRTCFRTNYFNKNELIMFSSENITENLKKLTPREMEILQMRFGLIDGESKTLREIGEYYGVSRAAIGLRETNILKKLRRPRNCSKIRPSIISNFKGSIHITDEERNELNDLENDICTSSLFFKHNSLVDIGFTKDRFDIIRKILQERNIIKIKEVEQKTGEEKEEQKKDEEKEEQKIGEEKEEQKMSRENANEIKNFGFSKIINTCLRRAGINTIDELTALSTEEIRKLKNMGRRRTKEIVLNLAERGLRLKEKDYKHTIASEKEEQSTEKSHNESEIEELKVKKNKLEAKLKTLEEQVEKAKGLLAEYNKLIGYDKEKTDDEALDFKDE